MCFKKLVFIFRRGCKFRLEIKTARKVKATVGNLMKPIEKSRIPCYNQKQIRMQFKSKRIQFIKSGLKRLVQYRCRRAQMSYKIVKVLTYNAKLYVVLVSLQYTQKPKKCYQSLFIVSIFCMRKVLRLVHVLTHNYWKSRLKIRLKNY